MAAWCGVVAFSGTWRSRSTPAPGRGEPREHRKKQEHLDGGFGSFSATVLVDDGDLHGGGELK